MTRKEPDATMSISTERPDVPTGETWRQFWHLLRRDVLAMVSLVWLVAVFLLCLWGRFFLHARSLTQNLDLRLLPPGFHHGLAYVLGTDGLGRPYAERLLVAGSTSIVIAVSVVVIASGVGSILGILAGFGPRSADSVIMRLSDITMAFPSMLLALVALYTLSSSTYVLIGVLIVTRLPIYIRTARGETLRTKGLLYVRAAEISGLSVTRIASRHILRSAMPALWTLATFEIALTMLTESGLSFLGVGVQPPGSSWGLLVSDGQTYLYSSWWVAVLPGLAIMITAAALRSFATIVGRVLEGY
jgi:peptide/nickel transport system permease protein